LLGEPAARHYGDADGNDVLPGRRGQRVESRRVEKAVDDPVARRSGCGRVYPPVVQTVVGAHVNDVVRDRAERGAGARDDALVRDLEGVVRKSVDVVDGYPRVRCPWKILGVVA